MDHGGCVTTYADAFATTAAPAASGWLPELRRAAFDRFSALGFPTTRNEDWHFTSVTRIAERTFKAVKPGASAHSANDITALAGGDAKKNAGILRAILSGAPGAPREACLFNASAALQAAGLATGWRAGAALAAESIDSGRALSRLDALRRMTHG